MAKDAGKKANDKKVISVKEEKKSSKILPTAKAVAKKTSEPVKAEKSEKKSTLLSKIAGKIFNGDKKEKQLAQNEIAEKTVKSGKAKSVALKSEKTVGPTEKLEKFEKAAEQKAPKGLKQNAQKMPEKKAQEVSAQGAQKQKLAQSEKLMKANKVSKTIAQEPKEIKEPPVVENIVDDEMRLSRKSSKRNQPQFQPTSDEEAKWYDLKEKYKGNRPSPYKMSEIYQEKTLLDHKVLGLGVILSVVNDRLEVLFQTGTKHLISNYKK